MKKQIKVRIRGVGDSEIYPTYRVSVDLGGKLLFSRRCFTSQRNEMIDLVTRLGAALGAEVVVTPRSMDLRPESTTEIILGVLKRHKGRMRAPALSEVLGKMSVSPSKRRASLLELCR